MAPNRKKGFLHAVGSALGQIAGSVGEVVSSAGELLVDSDLRRYVTCMTGSQQANTVYHHQPTANPVL